jgi:hypothetical protein
VPDSPRKPFAAKDKACEWLAAIVHWYNLQHRQSFLKFVTPRDATVLRPEKYVGNKPWTTKGSPAKSKALEKNDQVLETTGIGQYKSTAK